MEKKSVRTFGLQKRRALPSEEIEQKSQKIKQNLFEVSVFKKANVILFYIAKSEEVQTWHMIEDSLEVGKRIAVPVVDLAKKEIIAFEITNPKVTLRTGPFGIREPVEVERYLLPTKKIELVVIPGVAFDAQGGRIGFGGGFYDRFLKNISSRVSLIALAFECQVLVQVPCEEHDVAMNYIVTEKRTIYCK